MPRFSRVYVCDGHLPPGSYRPNWYELRAQYEALGDVGRIPPLLESTALEVIVGCDDLALEQLIPVARI